MKRLLLLVALFTLSASSKAADYLPGYIVLENNDTVQCKFKLGGFILATNFFNKLTVVNEQGEEQVYKAADKKVLAYGFVDGGRRFDYLYVDVKSKTESGFYQRIINGQHYKLYRHFVSAGGYGGISSASPIYVLFNPAGEYVRFDPCVVCPWKKQLRELMKDDPKALDVLENKAKRLDIPGFVFELNKV